MLLGFAVILSSGPVGVILLVVVIQVLVYREVISIGIGPSQDLSLPWFRSLHWHFLLSTNYFLYGESLIHYYKPLVRAFTAYLRFWWMHSYFLLQHIIDLSALVCIVLD